MMDVSIWSVKYAPKKLDEVIFQDLKQKTKFYSFLESGQIPHLMLSGFQGTGKTTLSKVLIKELGVNAMDVLKINCSDEKIDAIRNKVVSFSMSLPVGNFKVVQLEEFDYLSLDAQALLRGLISDSSESCRFIGTCNYANKIIPPLKSRFQHFEFKAPDKEKVALRAAQILDSESIEFDPVHLLTYVDITYPDIRQTIELLQASCQGGVLQEPGKLESTHDWKFSLLECISNGDFKSARKVICENSSKEEHEDVYRFLYENVDKMKVKDKDAAIVTIADYLYKHSIVSDTEINLAACLISLGNV
jgi:DNA polymerase III delta prime subunit